MSLLNLTFQVADYICRADYRTLPADIVEKAKLCLLDWIAVTLAGAREPISDITSDLLCQFGGGDQATVFGRMSRTNPLFACLINGINAHVLDFDDGLLEGPGHPSAPIIPSILALSEWKGFPGKSFIDSFVVAVQVFFAFDAVCMPSHGKKGWHSTGTLGHFAATAGSAKLLGLNSSQIVNALGISATQAAGMQNTFGTMCKPLNAGKAAMDGLLAALLAEKNFTSSNNGISGKGGFLEVYGSETTPEVLESALKGSSFLPNVKFKRYPSCFNTHAAIDCILSLRRQYDIKSEDITEIHCTTYPRCLQVSANEEPHTGLEAKFSVQYCIAVALQEGKVSVNSFDDSKVELPVLKSIMKKIKLTGEESFSKTRTSEVVLKCKNGEKFKEKVSLAEMFSNPRKEKEYVIEKFRDIASPLMTEERAEQIIKSVDSLEKVDSMSNITGHFRDLEVSRPSTK